MNNSLNLRIRLCVAASALCLTLVGCVGGGGYYDTDAGYDTNIGIGYSPGYIEPYGYSVGGWGDGYRLGPGRGGDRRSPQGGRAYHRAQPGRTAPSIPGGGHGGGRGGARGGAGQEHRR